MTMMRYALVAALVLGWIAAAVHGQVVFLYVDPVAGVDGVDAAVFQTVSYAAEQQISGAVVSVELIVSGGAPVIEEEVIELFGSVDSFGLNGAQSAAAGLRCDGVTIAAQRAVTIQDAAVTAVLTGNEGLFVLTDTGDVVVERSNISVSFAGADSKELLGGVICVTPGSDVTIRESSIVGHGTAAAFGGLLFAGRQSTVSIFDSSLSSGGALHAGGCVYGIETCLTVERSTFTDCIIAGAHDDTRGSAIAIVGTDASSPCVPSAIDVEFSSIHQAFLSSQEAFILVVEDTAADPACTLAQGDRYVGTVTCDGTVDDGDDAVVCDPGLFAATAENGTITCICPACPVGEYVVSECTMDTLRQCASCTNAPRSDVIFVDSDSGDCVWECPPSFYRVGDDCERCSECGYGLVVMEVCDATADTVCECAPDFYASGDDCVPCTECGYGEVQSTLCTASTDGTCICADGFFGSAPGGCGLCTECGVGEVESVPCSSGSDRQCACDSGFQLDQGSCVPLCGTGMIFVADTGLCAECPDCPHGEYALEECDGLSLAVCVACDNAPRSDVVYVGEGSSFDEACVWLCPPGFFRDGDLCLTCTEGCGPGLVVSSVCGPTQDTVCSTCEEVGLYLPANATFDDDCMFVCNTDYTLSFDVNGSEICAPCSECGVGEVVDVVCRPYADTLCTYCTDGPFDAVYIEVGGCDWICPTNFYRTVGGGSDICQACEECPLGSYASSGCDDGLLPYSCDLCDASIIPDDASFAFGPFDCAWECDAGFTLNESGDACIPCVPCPAGSFPVMQCTANAPATCSQCPIIPVDAFYTNECDWECGANFYRDGSQCVSCASPCVIGTFETSPCAHDSDPTCADCPSLPADMVYADNFCTAVCGPSYYDNGSGTCLSCNVCPFGYAPGLECSSDAGTAGTCYTWTATAEAHMDIIAGQTIDYVHLDVSDDNQYVGVMFDHQGEAGIPNVYTQTAPTNNGWRWTLLIFFSVGQSSYGYLSYGGARIGNDASSAAAGLFFVPSSRDVIFGTRSGNNNNLDVFGTGSTTTLNPPGGESVTVRLDPQTGDVENAYFYNFVHGEDYYDVVKGAEFYYRLGTASPSGGFGGDSCMPSWSNGGVGEFMDKREYGSGSCVGNSGQFIQRGTNIDSTRGLEVEYNGERVLLVASSSTSSDSLELRSAFGVDTWATSLCGLHIVVKEVVHMADGKVAVVGSVDGEISDCGSVVYTGHTRPGVYVAYAVVVDRGTGVVESVTYMDYDSGTSVAETVEDVVAHPTLPNYLIIVGSSSSGWRVYWANIMTGETGDISEVVQARVAVAVHHDIDTGATTLHVVAHVYPNVATTLGGYSQNSNSQGMLRLVRWDVSVF